MGSHRSRHVDAGGINIWIEEWGDPDGTPMFLCQRMGAQAFEWEPSMLAALVGVAMGGTQSLSRSTYAKFLPENTPDTASFYSFYDVMDKVSTVMGTFVFGFVEQLTGGMRGSVLAMAVFFVLGVTLLAVLRVRRM